MHLIVEFENQLKYCLSVNMIKNLSNQWSTLEGTACERLTGWQPLFWYDVIWIHAIPCYKPDHQLTYNIDLDAVHIWWIIVWLMDMCPEPRKKSDLSDIQNIEPWFIVNCIIFNLWCPWFVKDNTLYHNVICEVMKVLWF